MDILYGKKGTVVRYRKWVCTVILYFAPCMALSNSLNPEVSILLSLSMPKTSMQKWLSEAANTNTNAYLRGFKNNSMKETLTAILALDLGDKTSGLQIDPRIFKENMITQVPAVIVRIDSENYIFVGDTGLEYALSSIANQVQGESVGLYAMIDKLRQKDAKY